MDSLHVDEFPEARRRVVGEVSSLAGRTAGPVLYWMSRDQRVQDNWALIYSQKLALKHSVPLLVCFCLVPRFLEATFRHYNFMVEGLKEVEETLHQLRIPFHLLLGTAREQLPLLISKQQASAVVCDFSPLRVARGWVKDVAQQLDGIDVPLVQVDAHNIVPCWRASDKQEYSARTIRDKIHSKLPTYLVEFPLVVEHPYTTSDSAFQRVDWDAAWKSVEVEGGEGEVTWASPGTAAGLAVLAEFCQKRLKLFGSKRNDPNADALSNLSPWLHFGQVSAQRAVLTVQEHKTASNKDSLAAFIEEAVVRRELAENFCYYNQHYDSIEGAPAWAQETLRLHAGDKREVVYSEKQLEEAVTHDLLWNAAQLQMVRRGKMHGYLRMYWAKKILEWSLSPTEALRRAIKLNDKYQLDGRDPNGYVGCMWSICGVHDRGWAERPVFGKIRYMNYTGCKRKFDVDSFVRRFGGAKRKAEDMEAEAKDSSVSTKAKRMKIK